MNILHIQAGDLSGGAARGTYWLHQGLLECSINSKILSNKLNTLNDPSVVSILKNNRAIFNSFLRRQIDYLPYRFPGKKITTPFSIGIKGFNFLKTKEYKEADIIHLHWINDGFIDIKILKKINKPIIWTLRDMWPMTGGCHYAMDCENYKKECGKCPQLKSNKNFDLSKLVFNRKMKYLPTNIKLVGISNWISSVAKESLLLKNYNIRTIYNNINLNSFFPINKKTAKDSLGINSSKKMILAGSQNLYSFFKGFDKYLDAVKLLDKKKYFLCFFGASDKSEARTLGFEHKNFGFINDEKLLRKLYSAADIFVAPSVMEAFCKTIAESMACGTPVVCFDATGPKEIVDHKITGYKAKPFDVNDIANGINWIAKYPFYEKLCKDAREKVMKKFDNKVIAKEYIKLYNELLNIPKI